MDAGNFFCNFMHNEPSLSTLKQFASLKFTCNGNIQKICKLLYLFIISLAYGPRIIHFFLIQGYLVTMATKFPLQSPLSSVVSCCRMAKFSMAFNASPAKHCLSCNSLYSMVDGALSTHAVKAAFQLDRSFYHLKNCYCNSF